MKRDIIDFETPQVVGRRSGARGTRADSGRRASGARSGLYAGGRVGRRITRRGAALVLAVILLIAAGAGAFFIYSPFSFRLKKADFFMLILAKETTLSGANEAANQIVGAGGAGFVISDGEFKVAAFVYQKKGEAETVLERLKEDYPVAEVLALRQGRTRIRRFGSREKERQIGRLLDNCAVLAGELLAVVYALDTLAVSESGAMLSLDSIRERTAERAEEAYALSSEFPTVPAAKLASLYYAEINESLGQIGFKNADKRLSASLKSVACEAAYKSYLLREKLEALY